MEKKIAEYNKAQAALAKLQEKVDTLRAEIAVAQFGARRFEFNLMPVGNK